MHVVILAGGSGTRLWPLSRESFPKQFLTLHGPYSLLQETVLRFVEKYPILIVTQSSYERIVQRQLEQIGAGNVSILAEPARRSTAPAIALALRFLEETRQIGPKDPLLIVPSDHWLYPESSFLHYLDQIKSSVYEGKIVTFGVPPAHPETGFGYMKMGEPFDLVCYHVDQFVEKPSLERAEIFFQDPAYYWNLGILAFSSSTMWEAFSLYLPALFQLRGWAWADCLEYFCFLPNISIDYGVIEKSRQTVMCPLTLQWSDLGNWEHVYQTSTKDQDENATFGEVSLVNTRRCLIKTNRKMVAMIDLEDLVVVDGEDVLLIAKRDGISKIKTFVEQMGAHDLR